MRSQQTPDKCAWDRLRDAAPTGHDDRPAAIEKLKTAVGNDANATGRAKRTRLDRANRETIPVAPHLRTRQAENLDCHSELERAQPVIGEGDDTTVRMRRFAPGAF